MKSGALIFPAAALLALAGCMNVHVDPVEVKPITLNVNIRIIDEKLDNFFAFEKKYEQPPASIPSTRPTNVNSMESL